MVGRRMGHPPGAKSHPGPCDPAGNSRKLKQGRCRHSRKARGHTGRHEKAFFSQSTGAGVFDGQHGISFAISSIEAISCDMAAIAPVDDGSAAITGRDNGASAKLAIIRIVTSRRMVIWRFAARKSRKRSQI